MQADIYSIQGLAGLNEKINQIKRVLNPNTLNTKVFTNSIRESVAVRESQTNKTCILITNPNNNASIDYNNFINELLEV